MAFNGDLDATSTVTLLTRDELDLWIEECDDASSGYGSSSDTCETGSLSSDISDSDLSGEDSLEVTKFQNANALCDSLQYIRSVPDLCDVTFLVGNKKVPVHGIRAIMGSRSRVFYQLIMEHLHQAESDIKPKGSRVSKTTHAPTRLTIAVPEYDPEVFERLVHFVHCGSVQVGISNVAGLLCGATEFQLDDLRGACWDFVDRFLATGEAGQLLTSARAYSEHRACTRLLSKIYDNLNGVGSESQSRTCSYRETTV